MSECPYCNEYGAYVSTLSVECPNSKCAFYSEDQRLVRADRVLKTLEQKDEPFFPAYDVDDLLLDLDDDPDKTPVMPWGAFPTLPKP